MASKLETLPQEFAATSAQAIAIQVGLGPDSELGRMLARVRDALDVQA